MKKLLLFVVLIIAFYSCDGSKSSAMKIDVPSKVDYKMLGDEVEFKKLYNAAVARIDTNINSILKLDFRVSRPIEATVQVANRRTDDAFSVDIQYVNPTDRNKLSTTSFRSIKGEWTPIKVNSVRLLTGNAKTFQLENNAMKLSSITYERLSSAMSNTLEKYKDEEKYAYQYIKSVSVVRGKINISIQGKLKANDLLTSESESITL